MIITQTETFIMYLNFYMSSKQVFTILSMPTLLLIFPDSNLWIMNFPVQYRRHIGGKMMYAKTTWLKIVSL